ncbi:dihydroxyacetone kinase subunit DhaL [Xylophilus sp. GOD-11R]|uniref:dihydroxyacetone kinase subunit DhaL n=1 Tax=Xylophilus sp. GOD-11R TaxID=3089814 RepID=UPI00298C7B61|nr:dihydroxyacetone kinase subunit DhaL [Xylophilus sp. GOD-11R]WPB57328.1 dihydroxyacetone kinase subunit DhaL [Xylophilus sp. GOD-11R]
MNATATSSTQTVLLDSAGAVVLDLVEVINANRQYLSEIDGAIGDGDHGINMSKGFSLCGERLRGMQPPPTLGTAFDTLALTLMEGIGGSMGPLYGSFFQAWADRLDGQATLDAARFRAALDEAVQAVADIGGAQVGDKTLMDTLVPARDAFATALDAGADFSSALDALVEAARAGQQSTRDLRARIGRSARLGDRSIGVLDAGATSCLLLLEQLARSLQRLLVSPPATH